MASGGGDSESRAGRLVTETLDFDGGRDVTVFVPSAAPELIVFAGDGELIAPWGHDLDAAGLPPTMVVGAHRADDETQRIQEYSAGTDLAAFAFDPERFAAHERFFAEQLPRWVEARFGVALPADRTAVHGVSAGAELALAMGLRHPDRFEAVLATSPGAGYRPPTEWQSPLPRVSLVAGTDEPFFLDNAVRWADGLRSAGADVVFKEHPGAHGGGFWRESFPAMLAWVVR